MWSENGSIVLKKKNVLPWFSLSCNGGTAGKEQSCGKQRVYCNNSCSDGPQQQTEIQCVGWRGGIWERSSCICNGAGLFSQDLVLRTAIWC